MKVAAIQSDIVWHDPSANFEHLRPLIESACQQGAELVILPEMFSWGFSMDTQNIAEPPDGESASFLIDTARDLRVWICGTYPERSGQTPPAYNQLLLAGPDGQTHRYAKIHPFSYSGEDEHYMAGTQTLTVEVGTERSLRLSAFVCYDLRFGSDFWPLADSTDLYIIPANWPKARREHWQTLLRARAIENQAYVIGVNRVGVGDGVEYVGDSAAISPLGEVLAEAGDSEEVLVIDIDPAEVESTRQKFPFLADRQ